MDPKMSGLRIGQEVPGTPYRVLGVLGQGGQGIVVEAQHIWLKKRVVVKLLNADLADREDLGARIQHEAQALAEIRHPSIVPVIDGGVTAEASPRPFFVMEYLNGTTLQEVLRRRRNGLSIEFALSIAIDLLDGLEVAHGRDMIHRDIKPGNVFLHQVSPSEARGVLLDFGVAKMRGVSRATGPGFVGTFEYAAPEQLRGNVTPVSDLYAMGILLFQMISGRHPFQGARTRQDYADAHLFKKAPRLSSVGELSPALDEIIANSLEKEPSKRPASAYQFAAKLRAIRETLGLEERSRAHALVETDEMPLHTVLALMGMDKPHAEQATAPGGRAPAVETPVRGDSYTSPTTGTTKPPRAHDPAQEPRLPATTQPNAPYGGSTLESRKGEPELVSRRSRAAPTDVAPPEPRKRMAVARRPGAVSSTRYAEQAATGVTSTAPVSPRSSAGERSSSVTLALYIGVGAAAALIVLAGWIAVSRKAPAAATLPPGVPSSIQATEAATGALLPPVVVAAAMPTASAPAPTAAAPSAPAASAGSSVVASHPSSTAPRRAPIATAASGAGRVGSSSAHAAVSASAGKVPGSDLLRDWQPNR